MAGKGTLVVKVLGDDSGFKKTMGGLGGIATKAFAGVGLAAVGVGAALVKIGGDFDKQFDKIRVGTGATGDALDGLEGSFKNVLKTVPASFDDAGTAIADLNTRLGLTGKPLEALSGQMINLSRITGTDLTTNVDNITRVFGDWGVATEDQADGDGQALPGLPGLGHGLDDLSSSVVQFGAPLRNLGFGFDDSLALLAQFNKTGVNTETVFAGLKIGVGKLAKAGEDVPTTFRRVVDEITKLGPGSEATAKAIELFGQRAGPDLADAIAGGKFQIDEMLGAITGGKDTINGAAKDTESFGEKWTLIKNRVLVGLEPVATKVFDAIGTAMDRLGPVIDNLTVWFNDHIPQAVASLQAKWNEVWPQVQAVFETFAAVVSTVIDTITGLFHQSEDDVDGSTSRLSEIISQLVEVFSSAFAAIKVAVETVVKVVTDLWARFGDDILTYVRETWDNVQQFIQAALDIITGIFDLFTAIFTGKWGDAWDAIKQIVGGVWDAIRALVEQALNYIDTLIQVALGLISAAWSLAWNSLKTLAADAWEGIKSAVYTGAGAVVGFVKGLPGKIASAASGMWDGIKDAFKAAINWRHRQVEQLPVPVEVVRASRRSTYPARTPTSAAARSPSAAGTCRTSRRLHSGGVFRSPRPGGEGLALLRDRERVTTPESDDRLLQATTRGFAILADALVKAGMVDESRRVRRAADGGGGMSLNPSTPTKVGLEWPVLRQRGLTIDATTARAFRFTPASTVTADDVMVYVASALQSPTLLAEVVAWADLIPAAVTSTTYHPNEDVTVSDLNTSSGGGSPFYSRIDEAAFDGADYIDADTGTQTGAATFRIDSTAFSSGERVFSLTLSAYVAVTSSAGAATLRLLIDNVFHDAPATSLSAGTTSRVVHVGREPVDR